MDIKDIKDLIITIDQTSIDRVEIEKSDIKIIISKAILNGKDNTVYKNNNSKLDYVDAKKEIVELETNEDFIIKSPIVGTFYRASNPEGPPLINIGDVVEIGQTICIIEAMKSMNEIKADLAGEVVEFLINNEEIVEFGQPLIKIRRY